MTKAKGKNPSRGWTVIPGKDGTTATSPGLLAEYRKDGQRVVTVVRRGERLSEMRRPTTIGDLPEAAKFLNKLREQL